LARHAAIRAKARCIPTGQKVFINFLPSAIYDPTACLAHTFAAMHDLGVAPEDVVVEVVESQGGHELPHLRRVIDHCRGQGVAVALDNFRAGHTTLQLINTLQPDIVKVDRQLLAGVHRDHQRQVAVDDLVRICQDLGVISVATGIESLEDYAFVASVGFDVAQGYLIGHPAALPALDLGDRRPLQPMG
jgi:EAL domain-containing protein (putative c-di-GMP-specific phosphodiesterase class I)